MEFTLLIAIAAIPLAIAFSIPFFSKNPLTRALSLFLVLLSLWQTEIAFLYGDEFMTIETIGPLFRFFRLGPIFMMPTLYYFAYILVKKSKIRTKLAYAVNKGGLITLTVYSFIVYFLNMTPLGVESFVQDGSTASDPSHWRPVYGDYNISFTVSVLFVFLNTLFLFLAASRLQPGEEKKFYFKLITAAMIIFLNGIISITFLPYYVSSLNSLFAAGFLYISFFQLQSGEIYKINRELSREHQFLETISDISPNCIIVKNRHDKVVRVNAQFCELFSLSKEELIGQDFAAVISTVDLPLTSRKRVQKVTDQDGSRRFLHWHSREITVYGKEPYVLHFGIDITEQKRNEQILLSSEKLKVLGEMAASIAHELRNPLTTIRGFIQLFKEKNDQPIYENIMLEEIDRIDDVLKQLLILARPEAEENEDQNHSSINVMEEINKIHLLFQGVASNEHKGFIIENRCTEQPVVEMQKDHLKQILMNLVKNSLEALQEGGKVKIVLDKEDHRVRIRVIDNGTGITKERLSRIGEPYFTTKDKGTGIGLTICLKLIRENKGQMQVKSKINKGTAFTITFPELQESA
ncbi:ATP-binding protein [Metabacillus sp. GX 13764]|uniref:ATP-binding protein n=1 Tax=Metabacillus kandeliae TaxID=2900151 RepID=UPI001E3101A3|nr:ATP-binding protein [Metabacillus kandeliae]MCD7034115.1 ATP-binding protein [Metabacillus kandeliae]